MKMPVLYNTIRDRVLGRDGEACAGCGAVSVVHPMVGVSYSGAGFKSSPVCADCWRNPSHRMRPLKMHFFPRQQGEQAVALAGSGELGQ